MSLNDTPSSNRTHIGFFGRTNAGKSSLVNALTNQALSIVSSQEGTTTDPVQKAMELLPLGPVVITDTPGLDDNSLLGTKRQERAFQVLRSVDIAVLVIDILRLPFTESEQQLLNEFKKRNLPYLIILNKIDFYDKELSLSSESDMNAALDTLLHTHKELAPEKEHLILVSAKDNTGIFLCKEKLASFANTAKKAQPFIADCLSPLDTAILVIPIDHGAPKGRIILPQQQVLRELLEAGILTMVVRETELEEALKKVHPKVVITDSQAFHYVAPIVPDSIYLTSFSILMARAKGNLKQAIAGAFAIDNLKDNDTVLISEGCTHHRQCDDIGTVKLPAWIRSYTGKKLNFEWTSGREFKTDLSDYSVILHCGGCMLNDKEMNYRYQHAEEEHITITNYGIAIAHIRGILKRSIAIFEHQWENDK